MLSFGLAYGAFGTVQSSLARHALSSSQVIDVLSLYLTFSAVALEQLPGGLHARSSWRLIALV